MRAESSLHFFLCSLLLLSQIVSAQDDCAGEDDFAEYDFVNGLSKFADTPYFREEMRRYMNFQQEVLSGKISANSAKYLIFYPVHTGMGNRIEGMVSTFLLAYLSDRAFFLNWDYTDPVTRLPRIKEIEDDILDSPFYWNEKFIYQQFSDEYIKENSVEYELRGGKNTFDVPLVDEACCNNFGDYLSDKKFVFIKGNKYFGQLLASNPHYKEKFDKLFGPGVRRNMFAPLLGFLFRPKREIVDEVRDFIKQYDGKRVVGIQMRTTEKYSEKSYLPIYQTCSELVSDENTIFFVSTDDVTARSEIINYYGEDRVVYHSDTINMVKGQGRYRTTVYHALKDMLTLAACDQMLITCGSSFSRVAVGLARKPAMIASAGGNYCRWHDEKTCTQAVSLEPCSYHWFENNMKKCSCFNEQIDFQESAICGTNM